MVRTYSEIKLVTGCRLGGYPDHPVKKSSDTPLVTVFEMINIYFRHHFYQFISNKVAVYIKPAVIVDRLNYFLLVSFFLLCIAVLGDHQKYNGQQFNSFHLVIANKR